MFQEALAQCVQNFGEGPRAISLWDRLTYWRVARPDWFREWPDDPLETLFLNLDALRRDGVVVWGSIIQANSMLFSPGDRDCPGEVVYSLNRAVPADPHELGAVAEALAALKHTKPSAPDLALIADYLTDEATRVFGKRVPAAISPRRACRISTVYFIRKHLPGPARCLERPLMPVIVHPKPPYVAMVLPSRYWPPELIEWWQGADAKRGHSDL